jgi:hypothetical protein
MHGMIGSIGHGLFNNAQGLRFEGKKTNIHILRTILKLFHAEETLKLIAYERLNHGDSMVTYRADYFAKSRVPSATSQASHHITTLAV